MANFYLRKTQVFQAVKMLKWPFLGQVGFLKKVFFLVFIVSLAGFLFGFVFDQISPSILSQILGLSLLSFAFFAIFWHFGLFFERLKNPRPKVAIKDVLANIEAFNLADFLDYESALIFERAEAICSKRKTPLSASAVFYSLISQNSPLVSFVLSRLLLNQKQVQRASAQRVGQLTAMEDENLLEFLVDSFKNAQNRKNVLISPGNIFTALAKYEPCFKEILFEAELKAEDIDNLSWWWEENQKKIAERKKFWEYKNLVRMGSLGKEWSSGYTITLDRFAADYTEIVKIKGFEEIVGHEKEIEQLERSLSKSQFSNVLLVGDPGSGRGAIIQALTQRILFGESLPDLNYKRVVELDLPLLISNCQNKEEVAQILTKILQEALLAKNIILVIQDFHNFVESDQEQGPGKIDISGILLSYLQMPKFKIIAVTNFSDFHKTVDVSSLGSYFEKVEISQISQDETIRLLELFTPGWEAKYKKFISYPAMKELVIKAERYLPALPFPKKATDLMEEVLISLSQSKEEVLLPEHISKIVSDKTDIPVGQLSIQERQTLLNLENLIHERIINQEEAVKEVSSALRRARSDITVRKGPMGTFLFLGPTGVGKTETAKALAAIYFGTEERIIRLDLSEYQNQKDVDRLIGSVDEQSFFVSQVRETPFALVLLDEIEKAHPNILNLFLRILDEGFMTDGLGRKISFTNTIIIATSNAGYQIILESLAKNLEMPKIKDRLLNSIFEQGIFRPEFVNRFDAVVVFKSLSKENLLGIADLLMKKLKKNLMEKGVDLVITDALKEKIVELGYDPIFGAREMRRVIQDKVENVLASALLSGKLKRGNKAEIKVPEFELKII